jgi:hypothetical protein
VIRAGVVLTVLLAAVALLQIEGALRSQPDGVPVLACSACHDAMPVQVAPGR